MSKEQSQEYRSNGNHDWEEVVEGRFLTDQAGEIWEATDRLRVPGGWLYKTERTLFKDELGDVELRHSMNTVFVPMPEVVKHKV